VTVAPSTQVRESPARAALFDPQRWRADFPALHQEVRGHPLVYLDNAATTQKPRSVIAALQDYYERDNANIHRGVHTLSVRATTEYERARATVQRFVNARQTNEIVFVRGATEAVNLVAQSYGREHIGPGDEILITALEHHSNIVPWQLLCGQTGAALRVAPINDNGELLLSEFKQLLNPRTRLVAATHVSNALGTINPVREMITLAHANRTSILIDGAQAAPHLRIDVRDLDCDFYAFSSHKVFGPTGVGVLYGKAALLAQMPPYQGGGEMINSVTFEATTYAKPPHRFEAGTPHIAGAIGLAAALEYLEHVGLEAICEYEHGLLADATAAVTAVPGVRLIGTASDKAGVLSFVLADVHPHDVGTVLDELGIAIRTGHHCAQPVMARFGVPATCRASFAFYNTREDVAALVHGLRRAREVFG